MKEELLNELKTFDETLLKLSVRECHDIAECIETLNKALDEACKIIEPLMHSERYFIDENSKLCVEKYGYKPSDEWKKYFIEKVKHEK